MAGCRKLSKNRQHKREVIEKLHKQDGLGSREIAKKTGWAQRTVNVYLGRIRKESEQGFDNIVRQARTDKVNEVLMMPWRAA